MDVKVIGEPNWNSNFIVNGVIVLTTDIFTYKCTGQQCVTNKDGSCIHTSAVELYVLKDMEEQMKVFNMSKDFESKLSVTE